MIIKTKRIYDIPSDEDGYRVLVDRLWPRGIKKENAKVDLWVKSLAPTTELRKWFAHDVDKWLEFNKRYSSELIGNPDLDSFVQQIKDKDVVTLLFGAKDVEHNNAVVMSEVLKGLLV